MTFEEWKQRPVYVAQCKTAAVAYEIGVVTPLLRVIPKYRGPELLVLRKQVADEVRKRRNEKF